MNYALKMLATLVAFLTAEASAQPVPSHSHGTAVPKAPLLDKRSESTAMPVKAGVDDNSHRTDQTATNVVRGLFGYTLGSVWDGTDLDQIKYDEVRIHVGESVLLTPHGGRKMGEPLSATWPSASLIVASNDHRIVGIESEMSGTFGKSAKENFEKAGSIVESLLVELMSVKPTIAHTVLHPFVLLSANELTTITEGRIYRDFIERNPDDPDKTFILESGAIDQTGEHRLNRPIERELFCVIAADGRVIDVKADRSGIGRRDISPDSPRLSLNLAYFPLANELSISFTIRIRENPAEKRRLRELQSEIDRRMDDLRQREEGRREAERKRREEERKRREEEEKQRAEKRQREEAEKRKHEEEQRKREAEERRMWAKEGAEALARLPSEMVEIPDRWFLMSKYEVTQALWQEVMGDNPSPRKGPTLPVFKVSWDDCQTFVAKLNARSESVATGLVYRLPSWQEWAYCARGSESDEDPLCFSYFGQVFPFGRHEDGSAATPKTAGRMTWNNDNSDMQAHPVGQKEPNFFGLFDIRGNVNEWTASRDKDDMYAIVGDCGSYWTDLRKGEHSEMRKPRIGLHDTGLRLCAERRGAKHKGVSKNIGDIAAKDPPKREALTPAVNPTTNSIPNTRVPSPDKKEK